ncbi:MAG TPA: fused MFS/spermidine synthase [Vicinamibacterales bacterium]|jgi:spermidine synthase|nr:fused MFS/spermidine synthase [Vicinamibacterales bacterium]
MKARLLPALLLLFVCSGCAALIYEVVWFQLLELVIGSSAISMGVLLGTFMGGMCLGSLLLPRVLSPHTHPLRVYAYLELGIGAIGLVVLFAMPLVGGAYSAWAGYGIVGLLLRGIAAGICLIPPTLLMGATLPAIARWVEATPEGVSWLGFFYGGNTVGAVIGSLVAGYYLLRLYDLATTTYAAVALNVIVASVAFAVSKIAPYTPPVIAPEGPVSRPRGNAMVYTTIALSGFTALGAEVIWTRGLALVFGATTYTFSLILAVFLAGLGLGSTVGSAMTRSLKRPRVALALCQIGLCACIGWTAYVLTDSLPYWPVNPSITADPWFQFQLDLVRCLFAVLPGSILWGASFPLALASVVSEGEDPAQMVGSVYAANTFGAILGSLVTALVFMSQMGSQHSQQVLIVLAALAGLLLLLEEKVAPLAMVASAAFAAVFVLSVHPVNGLLVAYGRYSATEIGQSDIIYVGEGWNASVAVSQRPNGVLNYHNAGKVQASSEPQDMRLQRMLGHLTTLIPDHQDRVLVIGCGAGVTAGAVSVEPRLQNETIAEIEPLVPKVVSTYFAEHNFDVVRNPKVHVQIDDARHYVETTKEKFDAITSDPLDPWVKGAAMLYTADYFKLAKSRLKPGGVYTLFVQMYESNTEAVKSEIGSFFEAFPNGMIFANTYNGQGYDLVLVGQDQPTHINLDVIDAKLKSSEYATVMKSLNDIGMHSATDLFGTFAGQADDYKPWLADAQINRDKNLRLEYLAGKGLNLYHADTIFAELLPYGKDPRGIFTGSPELMSELMRNIHSLQHRD